MPRLPFHEKKRVILMQVQLDNLQRWIKYMHVVHWVYKYQISGNTHTLTMNTFYVEP